VAIIKELARKAFTRHETNEPCLARAVAASSWASRFAVLSSQRTRSSPSWGPMHWLT